MGLLVGRRGGGILARLTSPNSSGYSNSVYVFHPRGSNGTWLTHDEALKLSAVWACVRVISEAIASSTWDVFRESENGNRDYQPASKTYQLLNVRPNPETTPIGFHEAMMTVACLWGNAYAEIERDIVGRPIALWILHPDRCVQQRNQKTGELEISVKNFDKPPTTLKYVDVYHIHGLGIDGSCGLDLVGLAARGLLHVLAAEKFSLKYYENGTAMGGVLSTDLPLEQEDLDALRTQVELKNSGPDNAFKFLVLGGGMKWQSLSQSLNDGQHNETRLFLIEEVCRWFGVPPHKVAHLLHATFSNIEHQGIEFQRDALTPWARRCEQEVDYKLLPPGRMSIKINLDWAAEGDARSKADTDAVLVTNGLARRNELRRKRGMNTLGPEGEALTVMGQLVTLESVIKRSNEPAPSKQLAPQPSEPVGPDPAVKALLMSAVTRCLKRQGHRAMDAAQRAKTNRDFEKKTDPYTTGIIQYANEQMDEVMSVVLSLGMSTQQSGAVRSAIENRLVEHHVLLVRAYSRNDIKAQVNYLETTAATVAAYLHTTMGENI